MPYCESCGAQITQTAKFCGSCGAARNQTAQPAPQPVVNEKPRVEYYSPPNMAYVPSAPLPIMSQQPPVQQPFMLTQPVMQQPPPFQPQPVSPTVPLQQQTGEATIGVVLFRRMKSMGRYDTYAGVVTTQRLIFAQLTADMINEASKQALAQAKAEGKGFFGAWGDQLKATFGYTKKYLNMPPQAILSETPGNFALNNNTISEVKFHLKKDYEGHHHGFDVEVKSSMGNYKYNMDENGEFINILKQGYGNRVTMPFGYHYHAINIKF